MKERSQAMFQPRSQGLSSSCPKATREDGKRRDPGNEVGYVSPQTVPQTKASYPKLYRKKMSTGKAWFTIHKHKHKHKHKDVFTCDKHKDKVTYASAEA